MDDATPNFRFPEFNLDPALAEAVEAAPAEQIIEAIVRLEDPDQIPPHFTVVSRFNRIATGRFAAAHTWTIRSDPNVISLKAARPLGLHDEGGVLADLALLEDSPAPAGPSSSFGGRGCIVAALDFGLDFTHPNFLNSDGTTRLVALWHQGAPHDPARPNRYGYGRSYSREEINAALRTPDPYQALDYHPAISDKGNGSHGTHTLDIAAGNGRAHGARAGAAPDADLIFVHLSTPRLGEPGDLGDSVRVLEALDYVDRMARGRPWVANLSVGRTAGSHDGTSLVEQGMHELLRLGTGRAIVQSAGNYRSADLAVEGWLRDGESRDLEWIVDAADTTPNEIDVWYSGKDRFVVAIRPPHGSGFVEVTLGKAADIVHDGAVVGRIYHRRSDPNNKDNHVETFLYAGAPSGVWTVRLIGDYVIGGRFHAWIERDTAGQGAQSRFNGTTTSQSYTLGTIATSPLVITVGAYDANAMGAPLAPFSSCGPTRDERHDKPELLAPGVGVVAARSIPRDATRQEGLLVAMSGTSMAAPHVTGTVAAMFEAAGRAVSIDEIRECLQRSAEPLTDDDPGDCSAWGRLNTERAIREIRSLREAVPNSLPRADFFPPDLPVMTSESIIHDIATEDFLSPSEEQEAEAPIYEGALMNSDAAESYLDRVEHAQLNSYGERRESEISFLQRLLSEIGHVAPAGLSPAGLFRAALQDRLLMRNAHDLLRILAMPSRRPTDALRPGDWIVRAAPATGDVGHVSVLASGDLLTPSALAGAGIAAESTQPGQYGLVIEAGAFPHRRSQPFARRLLNSRGRVPPNTLVLRPRYSDSGAPADLPADEPGIMFEAEEGLEESISVDDVANEMNSLRCRFLSDHRATRADGTVRSFAAGSLLPIDNWNGTAAEATVAGFGVPKLVLAPAPASASGVRRYDVVLDAQRAAVVRNARELADWIAREGEYRKNRSTWEREKARLETLLAGRQETYSRMWVRQMMYNRFDVDIARWVTHYNTQLKPAAALDAGIVKSMLYQESRMGTSGAHLMPPPSDWSSSDRHPIRSRFNIGQAIDSWGPQQWLMMREMAATIFARHGLSTFERTWFGMSNDDYAAHAPFILALREFFEFRDGSNRNLMGTAARDLHEDYGFWIRTAIRWLFVKYTNLSKPTWAEAVRAYNGGGARARAYRDAVMARASSSDPYAAESVEAAPDGVAAEDTLQEDAPRPDSSATLTWEDLTRVNDSRGQPQVFYVVTGVPASVARIGDEGKAIFHLRVRNTNSVYNHKNVAIKHRLLNVLPNRQFREVKPWRQLATRDLEDESSRVIPLSIIGQTLLEAYNPDSPLTRLEVEYHWRETWEDAQEHYNRSGLDFMLVAPIEYLLGRKQRLTPRDLELNDPVRHKADYWIPLPGAGVNFTPDIRHPVTIQLDVTSSASSSAGSQKTASSGQTRSTTASSTISKTFSMQLNGEVSQGGSAKATVEVFELGVQEMFKLGGSLGYSRTRTDTSSTTVAREFSRSLMLSRTYATSQAVTTRTTLTISPPEVPQPRGTSGGKEPPVRSVGIGSVGVYLYPLIAFFEVPYVRFEGVNAMGQATRRSEGRVAVPFVTEWRLTSHRGG